MAHDADASRQDDDNPDRAFAPDDPSRSAAGDFMAGDMQEHEALEQTPDLLGLFDSQLAFIRREFPHAHPSTDGDEQLDELARVRLKHLKHQLALDTGERAAAIVGRLLRSAGPVAAVALAARQLGAW